MKIFKNYFFIDPFSGEQIKVNDLDINFHICRMAKSEIKHKLQVGSRYTIRVEVADTVIQPYIVDARCKLITVDETYYNFALSVDTKMILPPYEGSTNWLLSDQKHQITATAIHPWFVSVPLQFRLVDYNHDELTFIYNMDRRPILTSHMNLDLKLSIPNSEHFILPSKVIGLYKSEETYIIKFKINEPNNNFLKALSLIVLESGPTKVFKRFKESGLPVPSFKDNALCITASTDEDYERVLSLRLEAYKNKKNSKISDKTTTKDVSDIYDNYSNIYMVKLGPEIIATGRSVYNFGNYEQSEINQLGYEIPTFIKQGKFFEVSRLATQYKFRGKDLFFILLSFAFRSGFITGHRYLLADCEDHLLPLYLKWGAILLPEKIVHNLENIKLNVVYFDLHKTVKKSKIISKIPYLSKNYRSLADEVLKLSYSPFYK